MKKAELTAIQWLYLPSNNFFFLGKKFKNNDWWSTDVTLGSITINSAPACDYIQTA